MERECNAGTDQRAVQLQREAAMKREKERKKERGEEPMARRQIRELAG